MEESIELREEQFRQMFKRFNPFMIYLWRLGLGRWINIWPKGFGRIMVITHAGRNSCLMRRTPVNYALINGDLYCTAAFGIDTDWYKNVMANPNVEVWLPHGWWFAEAEDISENKLRIPLLRQIIISSGFAGILAGLDPNELTDEEFDEKTKEYRLILIKRTSARTGPDGPGDLAWVWPLATFLMLIKLILRRRD